jgi:hypothetical protein
MRYIQFTPGSRGIFGARGSRIDRSWLTENYLRLLEK